MGDSLVISFRFLDPRFHGRGDGADPEWPPSPLRAFQSLVAAASAIQRGSSLTQEARAALEWLETVWESSPPRIVAPTVFQRSDGYRVSVPNNALDLVGGAWSRGNYSMVGDANPATHRAMKTFRPTLFVDGDTVHFLFTLSDQVSTRELAHVETLKGIAACVVSLGWGIDLVVARAAVLGERELEALTGERWFVGVTNRRPLRVPLCGTLDALEHRYRGFLNRIRGDIWNPPPVFSRFGTVGYRRADDVRERAWVAFALRDMTDPSRFRGFEPTRETISVAGQFRHAVHEAARISKRDEWSDTEIAALVLGHGEARGEAHRAPGARRFAYLPIPTIYSHHGGERAGPIRRVLVTAYSDDLVAETAWVERALAGGTLVDEKTSMPNTLLEPITEREPTLARFVPITGASSWVSVSPVVLPGYDDPAHVRRRLSSSVGGVDKLKLLQQLEGRTEALLRKAIVQAGISNELAANATLSWQQTAFLSGVERAASYRVPRHLVRFPRLHVRIDWRTASGTPVLVPGPICIGGGRFYGMGLFTALRM